MNFENDNKKEKAEDGIILPALLLEGSRRLQWTWHIEMTTQRQIEKIETKIKKIINSFLKTEKYFNVDKTR